MGNINVNTHYCQYKIIRFTPFIETGEFANIGIILLCPDNGEVHYKLAPTRFGRITQFFHDMDKEDYRFAITSLEAELARIKELMQYYGGAPGAQQIFDDVTRQKSTMLSFTEPRPLKTHAIGNKVEELFNYHVHRSFVTKQYREATLVKNLRSSLKALNIERYFKKRKLSDGLIEVTFPLVNLVDKKPQGIIKPIAFDQETPTAIVEHADQWESRFKHFINGEAFEAKNTILPIELPNSNEKRILQYIDDFQHKLMDIGITVVDAQDQSRIIEFAKEHTKTPLPTTNA